MSPHITVVVPTFDRVELLRHCLTGIRGQSMAAEKYEIVVVDDGSTDGTTELLSAQASSGRVPLTWHRQSRAGPSAARNLGLLQARGELIAFTDDDCIPDCDWLASLSSALPDDQRCAGVGGRIRRARDTSIGRYIDNAGLMSSWVEDGVVEYLCTANALFRVKALRDIGGFNTSLGRTVTSDISLGGGEDVDVGCRLRRAGYHLIVSDDGLVYHHHHDSIREFFRMFWRHGYGKGTLSRLAPEELGKPGTTDFLKQLARALTSPSARGSSGIREACAWRALGAMRVIAFFSGQRAFFRDIRRSSPATTTPSERQ